MFDIISKSDNKELKKCVGQSIFIRFDIDPKTLTCTGDVKKFLARCAEMREEYKDGFYTLHEDKRDGSFHIITHNGRTSIRLNFIKEIYANIK